MADVSHESTVTQRFYRARSVAALGAALQAARTARGMTQDDLAQQIGSSRPTLSRIERGRPAMTDAVLDALAACGYEVVVVPRGAVVTVTT